MKSKFLNILALVLLGFVSPGIAESDLTSEEVVALAHRLTEDYFSDFQHPDTGILYGARLSGKENWTTPEEVLRELPKPWGYGSRIADTVLHTGHMLVALLDAREARPDPIFEKQIRRHFEALRLIGSLPETHPKPGKPALVGLVPRGPHPDNLSAYFDDSSMDQHTTYIISLAVYANSPLASPEDKAWISESLGKVGRRLEKNGWSIKRADGGTQSHVGFSWKGFNSSHASILLPSVLALYHGTGDEHWRKLYEHFLSEADGRRWKEVHPGPQIRINAHPIYANQNTFRVHAWHRFESSPERREVIKGLLGQSTEMQLNRAFPGEMYRKFHSDETWQRVAREFDWNNTELRDADEAWSKFSPSFLAGKDAGLAALAHVRFPLGGFHMALLSENPEIVREVVPDIWKMLHNVDLDKIDAGETHYLFSVVALHLYATCFRHPEWLKSSEAKTEPAYGPELPIIAEAGIGPTQDVVVEGQRAYAIGRSQLRILDISQPRTPAVLGTLGKLGSVRQIVVDEGIVYISARQDGLFVVDATDPANPKVIKHYDTIEFATGLALSGDVLLVACRHYGVELIDVSDPADPQHLSIVRTGEAQSLTTRDHYAYVGVWAAAEVVTVDIEDPWKPEIVSRSKLRGYGDGVSVSGDYLYASTGHHLKTLPRKTPDDPGFGAGHGIEIFDLNDPAKPTWISRTEFPRLYEIGNDTWRVTAHGSLLYATDTYNGVFVLDAEDPLSPRFLGHHQLPQGKNGRPFGFVGGLAVIDEHILMAGGDTELHVLDFPDARFSPAETGIPPTIGKRPDRPTKEDSRLYQPGQQVYGVDFLADDRAIVACGEGGAHVVRLWPEIKPLSHFETEGFATDVAVNGDLIFLAQSAGGLSICRISPDSDQLEEIGHYASPPDAIRQVEVPGEGHYALIQVGAAKFHIVDVRDPTQPKAVLKDSRHGLLYGDQMMRGLVEDRYTTVFWHVSGTHWYDLKADPPAFTGDIFPARLGSPNGQVSLGDRSLITTRGGYVLLDREETRTIEEVGIIKYVPGSPHLGVPNIDGDLLYSANRAYGEVTVTDISNPQKPELVDRFTTPGNPGRPFVKKDCLILPAGYYGLMVMPLSN